ncbi:hypothetical protein WJX72_010584 [[Myrmecia] bisecta]|uniref:UMP-CMP kinase n=1 Tax=[Myrmecia] bisecta TaxID=41462 RepID=A0AAW1PAN8_9CHLO
MAGRQRLLQVLRVARRADSIGPAHIHRANLPPVCLASYTPKTYATAASSSQRLPLPAAASESTQLPWGRLGLGFAAAGIAVAATSSAVPVASCTAGSVKQEAAHIDLSRAGMKVAETDRIVVFVLGGPGSGKGTQCSKLVEEFGMLHLSAGDLLRAHMKSGTSDGNMVADMIKQGQIVPSRVTISLLEKAMTESGKTKFLIDGFPRNEENRAAFEQQTGTEPKFILFFDCPEEVMERRLLGRNEGRTDDNIETIRKRFKVFLQASMPVIEFYEKRGVVRRFNADRTPEEVYAEVRKLFLDL